MRRMLFVVFVLILVVGTIGYAVYRERGWGGVGLMGIIAVVIFASVVALFQSGPGRNVWEIFMQDPRDD